MSTLVPDENSMNDPLCNSSFGSMVRLDYVTPDTTIVGLHDFVKVYISSLLKSFLLIMCIDARESTTNSLSSGFKVDAGRHLFSRDEKNAL